MTAKEIADALTGAEARIVAHAFLAALERFDAQQQTQTLVIDLQNAAATAEGLALGLRQAA